MWRVEQRGPDFRAWWHGGLVARGSRAVVAARMAELGGPAWDDLVED